MSKPKNKEKKPQYFEHLEREYEHQKRELLDTTFTLRKTQQKLTFLTLQNQRLERDRQTQLRLLNEHIEQLNIKNQTNEKRLLTMRNDLTNAQVQNKKLANTIAFTEKTLNEERVERSKESQEAKKNHQFEVARLENMLVDYKLYMGQRDTRQREINELAEARQLEIANRIREVAEKEREKVQATDKIRDEMGCKIRQMRTNLLSLKKEELQTTTRLTMLQNHQLTSQLEYQSKQTEKIVFRNTELQGKVTQLQQDIAIHQQVEEELAKRAQVSKGIIKKLHARICQLEAQIDQATPSMTPNPSAQSLTNQQQEVLMQTVDKQLGNAERRYAQLNIKYREALADRQKAQTRWQQSQKVRNNIMQALIRGFELSEGKDGGDLRVDFERVAKVPVAEWSKQQVLAVIQVLLVSCQPYISASSVNLPPMKKIILTEERPQERKALPKLLTEREKNRLHQSASQGKFDGDDLCWQVRTQVCQQKWRGSIGTKMLGGKVREWGKVVTPQHKPSLQRKYKLAAHRYGS